MYFNDLHMESDWGLKVYKKKNNNNNRTPGQVWSGTHPPFPSPAPLELGLVRVSPPPICSSQSTP